MYSGHQSDRAYIGRSPGERGATDVSKGKAKRVALRAGKVPGGAKPSQKALGKIFDNPVRGHCQTNVAERVWRW